MSSRKKDLRAKRQPPAYASTGTAYLAEIKASPLSWEGEHVTTSGMVSRAFNVSKRTFENKWNKALKQKRSSGQPKFREGVHYHWLTPQETRLVKQALTAGCEGRSAKRRALQLYGITTNTTRIMVFTKRGMTKLGTKHFDSDEADDVLEELIETYFTVREQLPTKAAELAQRSFQAGAEFGLAQSRAQLEEIKAGVNSLLALHQDQKAKSAKVASDHSAAMNKRKDEKRQEQQVDDLLNDTLDALQPGKSIADHPGQGSLYEGALGAMSKQQLLGVTQAVLAGQGLRLVEIGGAA